MSPCIKNGESGFMLARIEMFKKPYSVRLIYAHRFRLSVPAPSYSRPPIKRTTIAASWLNFRVRNENGCDPTAKAPEQKIQRPKQNQPSDLLICYSQARKPQIIATLKFLSLLPEERNIRSISTSRLHALRRLHLKPINVVIFYGS